jgi:hypothetical protein
VLSLVNLWWFIFRISLFTASHMMHILNICMLFLMSCAMHVYLVTLRSAPFALIVCLFLVMLLHRRALRWIRQRLLPSQAGHFRLRSRGFEVFLVLQFLPVFHAGFQHHCSTSPRVDKKWSAVSMGTSMTTSF